MLVRGSDVALPPQRSKQQVLPLQGEGHGHCSLKVMLAWEFFSFLFFLSSGQEGKNEPGDSVLKGEISL